MSNRTWSLTDAATVSALIDTRQRIRAFEVSADRVNREKLGVEIVQCPHGTVFSTTDGGFTLVPVEVITFALGNGTLAEAARRIMDDLDRKLRDEFGVVLRESPEETKRRESR